MKLCKKQFIADRQFAAFQFCSAINICTVLYSFVFSSSTEVMMSYSFFGSVLYIYFYVAKDIFHSHTLFFLDFTMTTFKNLSYSILIVVICAIFKSA